MKGPITIILAVLIAAAAVSGCATVNTSLQPAATATANPASVDGTVQGPIDSSATARPSSAVTPAPGPSATARPSSTVTPTATISASATPTPGPTAVPDKTVILNVTGDVKNPLALSAYDLSRYPRVSIVNLTYGAHGSKYQMTATGASLNAILNVAQPNSEKSQVIFYGSDGYVGYILLSVIRANESAMVSLDWSTTDDSAAAGGGLRNIQPNQYYGQMWVFNLYKIQVVAYG